MVGRKPIKATRPYWIQPCTRANPSETARTSARSRDEEAEEQTPEQTLSTNPQSTSPLFKVPREIRDYVFKLALTTYEDPTIPYHFETRVPDCLQRSFPHHRPPHYRHLRTDTALLRTCRLVYNETALLPVSVNTHILCYPDIPLRGLSYPMPTVATSYFKQMTSIQLAAVQQIHIFAHRYRLIAQDPGRYLSFGAFAELGSLRGEKGAKTGDREGTCGIGGPYPKTMTITIRNCDWRFCNEAGSARSARSDRSDFHLRTMLENRHWESVFGGLKELRIELEIYNQEREVLVPTINMLKEFDFDIGGGESLVAEETVEENVWMAPNIENKGEEMEHYVAALLWKVKSVKPLKEPRNE